MTDLTMLYPNERTALFIDGSNLFAASKALGFDIDYKKLLAFFQQKTILLRATYYTAIVDTEEFTAIRPLVDFLSYNGFHLVTKSAKQFVDHLGRQKIKGNMDSDISTDMIVASYESKLDHMILFSGDGDFRPVIEAAQRRGVRCTIVSTLRSDPPMIADELRRQADQYIDLEELRPYIARERDPNRVQRQRFNRNIPQGEEYEEGYEPVGVGKITRNE